MLLKDAVGNFRPYGKYPANEVKCVFYPELKGPALEAYREMVSNLKTKAMQELGLGPSDIVVRPLIPNDLGVGASSPDYRVGLTALTWTTIINAASISDSRFVGINGVALTANSTILPTLAVGADVKNIVGNAEQIRITRKGSVARYWQVKPIIGFKNMVGYVDDPIIIDQNTTITIEGLSRLASSIAGLDLIGAVAEKRGLLINP